MIVTKNLYYLKFPISFPDIGTYPKRFFIEITPGNTRNNNLYHPIHKHVLFANELFMCISESRP